MATHSSTLAWEIPWTEKPGRLSPWGREESDIPTPVFLLGKSYGQRSRAGYSPGGHKESDMTEQLPLSDDCKNRSSLLSTSAVPGIANNSL